MLTTSTRWLLVAHVDEQHKPTNTGLLAARCLPRCTVALTGGRQPPQLSAELSGQRAVVLFPREDALPLARFADGAPLTVVVPDGTWRQASKAMVRLPELRDLPRVTLPPGPPTRYRLRAEPRPGGLATLEAMARAMDLLEGEGTSAPLLDFFARFVDRTLWLRGALPAVAVHGGIPPMAIEAGVRGHHPPGSRGATQRARPQRDDPAG